MALRYAELAAACEGLEREPSYLKKNAIVARLLKSVPKEDIERIVMLLLGRTCPAYVSVETGVGPSQVLRAIAKASGCAAGDAESAMKAVGDLGEVARRLLPERAPELAMDDVFTTIEGLPRVTGEGSVERKAESVAGLLRRSSPLEAKFVVRTVLGDMRTGLAEGRVRDAIAAAYGLPKADVERAYMFVTDYAMVAKAAAEGKAALAALMPSVGHPIQPMLAQPSEGIDEITKRIKGRAVYEYKLDGIRVEVHKRGNEITLFSRKLEDYTPMFPDIIPPLRRAIRARRAVLDGELVAKDEAGRPMPFQNVLRRRRKYGVEAEAERVPVEVHFFDVLVRNGRSLLGLSYLKRRRALERLVEPVRGRVFVVEQIVSDDPIEVRAFMRKSLAAGHEGLLAKDPRSTYRAGRREFLWLKWKAAPSTLDLVVVGALWGKGKRAGWFGSYVLAARDEETGRFKSTTKCGTGFSDEDFERLTAEFKKIQLQGPHPLVDIGGALKCDAYFPPKVVFEIVGEEVQRSPPDRHAAGYGVRFPRLVRVREDKGPVDANTVADVARMFAKQRGRGGARGAR